MRLAIVGSTNLTPGQSDVAYWLVDAILQKYNWWNSIEVVSGGANGIDHIAQWTAEDLGIPVKIFEPDIQQWESFDGVDGFHLKGFKERNVEIVEYCDELVCIRSVQSRTYGSGWTADRAEEMGKDVRRITLP